PTGPSPVRPGRPATNTAWPDAAPGRRTRATPPGLRATGSCSGRRSTTRPATATAGRDAPAPTVRPPACVVPGPPPRSATSPCSCRSDRRRVQRESRRDPARPAPSSLPAAALVQPARHFGLPPTLRPAVARLTGKNAGVGHPDASCGIDAQVRCLLGDPGRGRAPGEPAPFFGQVGLVVEAACHGQLRQGLRRPSQQRLLRPQIG